MRISRENNYVELRELSIVLVLKEEKRFDEMLKVISPKRWRIINRSLLPVYVHEQK